MVEISDYHNIRIPYDKRRDILWKTLCKNYFQNFISSDACVLELGSGYGHFINNIKCAKRIAVDQWPGMTKYLAPDIDAIIGKISDLSSIADYSVDFALASNLFEHIEQDEFALVLAQLKTKLKYSGTLNILQPNYRFSYREYFDDYTHLSVYSDRSLKDFLEVHGFQVFYCHPKFLPLTLKSVFPVYPLLIKMYLKLPYKPLGKQMFVRASVDGKQSCIMLPPT